MRRNILLLAVLAWAGLSACSGESDVHVLAGAAGTTADESTVHLDFTFELDGAGVDYDTGIAMSVDTTLDGRELQGTVELAGEELPFLLVEETYYYEMGELLPDGKQWIRMTSEEASELAEIDAASAQELDVTASVIPFLESAEDVEELGAETVAGADTTHYRATVPTDELPNLDDVLTAEGSAMVDGLFGDRVTFDVWVDGDDRVRRLEYSVDLSTAPSPPAGLPSAGTMTWQFELSDFGVPVDVQEPSAADVVDYSELAG